MHGILELLEFFSISCSRTLGGMMDMMMLVMRMFMMIMMIIMMMTMISRRRFHPLEPVRLARGICTRGALATGSVLLPMAPIMVSKSR